MPNSTLPAESLTCEQIRALDAYAIDILGVPGIVLMENAARNAADVLLASLPEPARAHVVALCGPGNNGGDGYALARRLHVAGVRVTIVCAAPRAQVRGNAAINLAICERLRLPIVDAAQAGGLEPARRAIESADVIVDALLGTGASGPPRGTVADLIRLANAARAARRLAIDVPSGLDADAGVVCEPCFRADTTVTFVAEKSGFRGPAAREVLGCVMVADIGVPSALARRRKDFEEST